MHLCIGSDLLLIMLFILNGFDCLRGLLQCSYIDNSVAKLIVEGSLNWPISS